MPDSVEPKRPSPPPVPLHRDGVEPSKDRPSGPGDTGPGSTADRNVREQKEKSSPPAPPRR